MTALTFTGTAHDAAAHLLAESALGFVFERVGRLTASADRITVSIAEADRRTLSTGELALWDVLESISGAGGEQPIYPYTIARHLDAPNRVAVVEALGLLFGLTTLANVAAEVAL